MATATYHEETTDREGVGFAQQISFQFGQVGRFIQLGPLFLLLNCQFRLELEWTVIIGWHSIYVSSLGAEKIAPMLRSDLYAPFAATFCKAPSLVIARSLIGVQKVSVLTVLFYANLPGAVVLLGLTYLFETPIWAMSAQTVGYVIGLCLCVCGSHFATNLSLKTEKAGITATIKTFTIPLAVLLDYVVLSELPSPLKSGGVVLIVFGTGVVAVYTWWRHRKETLHKNFMQSLDFDKY